MTSVLASGPAEVRMARAFFGPALLSTCVAAGRGYAFVLGDVGERQFTFDGELIVEVRTFATYALAKAWVRADIEQRRRAS